MMVLRLMLKGILKLYFKLVLSSLIDEKSNCQRNSGKLAIKYKLGFRLFLFFTSKAQNVQCVAHSVICVWAIAEKIQTEGLRIENSPEIFQGQRQRQSSAPRYSTELHQIPWKFQGQKLNKALELPHYFFLVTLWKFHFVFN